jgi:hypothetical protein
MCPVVPPSPPPPPCPLSATQSTPFAPHAAGGGGDELPAPTLAPAPHAGFATLYRCREACEPRCTPQAPPLLEYACTPPKPREQRRVPVPLMPSHLDSYSQGLVYDHERGIQTSAQGARVHKRAHCLGSFRTPRYVRPLPHTHAQREGECHVICVQVEHWGWRALPSDLGFY